MADVWQEKWDRINELSSGGQGTTLLVRSKSDGTEAVLKQLKNNKSPQARRRMHQEVANLRVVANAGGRVPRVLDDNVAQFEDTAVKLYFVMERIGGSTLDDHVKQKGRMDLDQAVRLTLDICETLTIAHAEKVLHRDLKPKNIIIADDDVPQATILDYGLSFNSSDGPAPDSITKTDETFRNEFLSLPEANVGGGDRRDPRSDYTAVCGLFYFCLTGFYPQLLRDGVDKAPHQRSGFSIREMMGEHPMTPHLDAFFYTGFAANLADRFQTLEDMSSRLRAILDSAAVSPAEDPRVVAARCSERLRKTNRPVQLGEFKKAMDAVFNGMSQYVLSKLQRDVGLFVVAPIGLMPQSLKLPPDFEDIGSSCGFVVRTEHHQMGDVLVYKVGATGNDAVLFRTVIPQTQLGPFGGPNRSGQSSIEWQEAFRYPGVSPPVNELFIEDLKRSLSQLMERFAA